MLIRLLLIGLALSYANAAVYADDPPGIFGKQNALYLGEGHVLRAAEPRQLTVRGHVLQFEYSPTGEKIAYLSLKNDHGLRYWKVSFVDTWRSEPFEVTLLKGDAATSDPESGAPDDDGVTDVLNLGGWSAEGRYLLITESDWHEEVTPVNAAPGVSAHPGYLEYSYYVADTLASPPTLRRIATGNDVDVPQFAWSPDHTRILFAPTYWRRSNDATPPGILSLTPSFSLPEIYTVADGGVQTLQTGARAGLLGWLDDRHLVGMLLPEKEGGKRQYFLRDLATGLDKEADPTKPRSLTGFLYVVPRIFSTRHHPDLLLETMPHHLDHSSKQASVEASTLWVNNNAKVKSYSHLAVGIVPGPADPQATWSPEGNAVAYVAHGDIFVTDILREDATPREKLVLGEPLTCAEETSLAVYNLKQIGLGTVQYALDNDERFPAAKDFEEKIFPYIKIDGVFQIGRNRFVYSGTDVQLGTLDDPSKYILGALDTPCAHIVLYGDGYVRTYPR